MKDRMYRLVVLISGNGSNLQAIIDAIQQGNLSARICAVISNKPGAYGLQRAKAANIPVHVIDHTHYPNRESFDLALQQEIDAYQPDLVVLAGFMRILTTGFVTHYLGRMINIHPSLLPDYQGLNTHQRALDDQRKIHGVSVHFVTPELDGGPVFLQSQVAVKPDDNADTLAKRVLEQEHIIYPLAIKWIAEKRIQYQNDRILFDGKPLTSPILLQQIDASG